MALVIPYQVEPAKSGRSTCKASKLPIEKGELRFGSFVDMGGHGSYHWRKLDYITAKQIAGVNTKMGGVAKLGGYADLTAVQQKKIVKAFDAAIKKGAATDKAKAKVLADKDKAKAAKAKAKAGKAKAKAKAIELKDKLKAKKLGKFAMKGSKVAAAKAKVVEAKVAAVVEAKVVAVQAIAPAAKRSRTVAAPAGAAPPAEMQHRFLDAAKINDFKTVREMLEETPTLINVQPGGRWSALHQAAAGGKPTAVKMLLSKGGSVTLLTKDKKTPQEVAHASCTALVAPPPPRKGAGDSGEPAAKRKRGE